MKHLCIHTNTNTLLGTLSAAGTPRFKKDGNYFTDESGFYAQHWRKQGHEVWNHGINAKQGFSKRLWDFSEVIGDQISENGGADVLAYWGHGYKTGIQLGFKWKNGAQMMARNMRGLGAKTLILYACSCAKGQDNFMKWIAEELIALGIRDFKLFGHDRRGDTMRNPFIVAYKPKRLGIGGMDNPYRYKPERIEFRNIMENWSAWKENLDSDLRFEFPFMQIENEKKWF